jgi:hypothetical protein
VRPELSPYLLSKSWEPFLSKFISFSSSSTLFEELESLRELNERQELERAKQALELKDRQTDLLLKEVDHRVKNSLQIVSSCICKAEQQAQPSLNSAVPLLV